MTKNIEENEIIDSSTKSKLKEDQTGDISMNDIMKIFGELMNQPKKSFLIYSSSLKTDK